MSNAFLRRPTKAELRAGRPYSWYHVFTHAVEGVSPFATDELRYAFIDNLARRLPGAFESPRGPEVFHEIDFVSMATMSNHPHFVARQGSDPEALSRFTGNVLRATALRYNALTGHTGQVFLRPFEAKLLPTPADVKRAIAYVHNNPKREDLIDELTTHRKYLAADNSSFVNVSRGLELFGGIDAYADYFATYRQLRS